jgi:capsule polysaccharide export protein KpsE/RkpR
MTYAMQNEFSFSGLIRVIQRNFKTLFVLGTIAFILSAIFSGPTFIKPKYKSSAIVYPVNLFPYSIESQTEQMIQLFTATEIRDYIIDKYNLYKRWDVDVDSPKARFFIQQLYNENVTINRTNFESVSISVMDFNPDTAKLIADDILDRFNHKTRQIKREKSGENLIMAEQALAFRRKKLDSIESRLSTLRMENHMLSFDIQASEVTQGYYRMLANGKGGNKVDEASELLRNLEVYGGEFKELTVLRNRLLDDYAAWQIQYNNFYNDVQKELTYLSVIERPEVPVKKSYPVRWIIVVSSVLGTLLMALVLFSLFQKDNFGPILK